MKLSPATHKALSSLVFIGISGTLHVAFFYLANSLYQSFKFTQAKPEPVVINVTLEPQIIEAPQKQAELPQVEEHEQPKKLFKKEVLSHPHSSGEPTQQSTPDATMIGETTHNESAVPKSPSSITGNKEPPYPESARRLRKTGTVLLLVRVLTDGKAGSVDILDSSGTDSLDQSARDTVLTWRFNPAYLNGGAIESTVKIPITFKLTNVR